MAIGQRQTPTPAITQQPYTNQVVAQQPAPYEYQVPGQQIYQHPVQQPRNTTGQTPAPYIAQVPLLIFHLDLFLI